MATSPPKWDEIGSGPASPKVPDAPPGETKSSRKKDSPANSQPRELELEDLGELLSKPHTPVEWLVENRLVAGSVSMFASKPKVGKSTTVRHLAFCVARGEPFLGWEVKQGRVIYLNLEERVEDVVEAFRAMGATAEDPIQITSAGDVEALIATLRRLLPALLIVDPLFRLIRVRDEKAYAEVYANMAPLIDVARETGTHILCSHHSPKQAREDAIDAPLGSTALGGAVSSLFELRRNPETGMRTIRSTQRIGNDLPEMVLRFDTNTRNLQLAGTRKEFEITSLKPTILAALSDTPLTENQIFELVEHGKTGAKRTALRSLFKDRKVERSGTGKKGNPYLYRKARSHVSGPTEEDGNENLPEETPSTEEILVPSSSFLYGNEETRISRAHEVYLDSSEMLVPGKTENRLISDFGERAFQSTSTDVPLAEPNTVSLAGNQCPTSARMGVPSSLKRPTDLMGQSALAGQSDTDGLVEIVI
jgi:AAA domain